MTPPPCCAPSAGPGIDHDPSQNLRHHLPQRRTGRPLSGRGCTGLCHGPPVHAASIPKTRPGSSSVCRPSSPAWAFSSTKTLNASAGFVTCAAWTRFNCTATKPRETSRTWAVGSSRVSGSEDRNHWTNLDVPSAVLLLDAFDPARVGGTGKTFNWELARNTASRRPLVLAGGLTPENIIQAIQTVRPYAVDVSSGVESEPGKKDHEKLARFIQHAKSVR